MAKFKKLGSYLRKKRIENGFSQVGLAKMLGYSGSQFVSNWERGQCAPPLPDIHKMIRVLKLQRESLVRVMLEDSTLEIKKRIYR